MEAEDITSEALPPDSTISAILDDFREQMSLRGDILAERAQEPLRIIWETMLGDLADLEVVPSKDRRWKILGFQGTNPITDLRGAGLLPLSCIAAAISSSSIVLEHMKCSIAAGLAKDLEGDIDGYVPTMAAAVQLSSRLAGLLHIQTLSESRPASHTYAIFHMPLTYGNNPDTRGQLTKAVTPMVFFDFFSIGFVLLLAMFDIFKDNIGYMDFPKVLNAVVETLDNTLRQASSMLPRSVEASKEPREIRTSNSSPSFHVDIEGLVMETSRNLQLGTHISTVTSARKEEARITATSSPLLPTNGAKVSPKPGTVVPSWTRWWHAWTPRKVVAAFPKRVEGEPKAPPLSLPVTPQSLHIFDRELSDEGKSLLSIALRPSILDTGTRLHDDDAKGVGTEDNSHQSDEERSRASVLEHCCSSAALLKVDEMHILSEACEEPGGDSVKVLDAVVAAVTARVQRIARSNSMIHRVVVRSLEAPCGLGSMTPALKSSRHGNAGMLLRLMELGVDILNGADASGWTALDWCSCYGHADCVHVLYDALALSRRTGAVRLENPPTQREIAHTIGMALSTKSAGALATAEALLLRSNGIMSEDLDEIERTQKHWCGSDHISSTLLKDYRKYRLKGHPSSSNGSCHSGESQAESHESQNKRPPVDFTLSFQARFERQRMAGYLWRFRRPAMLVWWSHLTQNAARKAARCHVAGRPAVEPDSKSEAGLVLRGTLAARERSPFPVVSPPALNFGFLAEHAIRLIVRFVF